MKSGSGNNLLALGSAAVVAVYAAGYVRTKPAADRLAAQSAGRRPPPAAPALPSDAPALVNDTLVVAVASRDSVQSTAGSSTAPDEQLAVKAVQPSGARSEADDSASGAAVHDASHGATHGATRDATHDATHAPAASAPTSTPASTSSSTTATSTTSTTSTAATASGASAPPAVAVDSPTVAAAAAATATTQAAPKAGAHRDGVFWGRGTSRHGDIVATIEIKDGRIISAVISQCLTRYSCSWISALPGQVVARQSADVDTVSGATQSADAFYWAIVQALSQAK